MLNKIIQKISNLQSYLSICYSQRIRGLKREKKKIGARSGQDKKVAGKNSINVLFCIATRFFLQILVLKLTKFWRDVKMQGLK